MSCCMPYKRLNTSNREVDFVTRDGKVMVASNSGNFLQNQTATRQAFLPPGLLPGGQLINWGDIPLPYRSDVKRSDFVDSTDNDFNWVVLRGEVELGGSHRNATDAAVAPLQHRRLRRRLNAGRDQSVFGPEAAVSGGEFGEHRCFLRFR